MCIAARWINEYGKRRIKAELKSVQSTYILIESAQLIEKEIFEKKINYLHYSLINRDIFSIICFNLCCSSLAVLSLSLAVIWLMLVTMNVAAINGRHTNNFTVEWLEICRVPPTDKSNTSSDYSSYYRYIYVRKRSQSERARAKMPNATYARA